VGDPARGEQLATAVLADDDARAEVVAPITNAILLTTGVPAAQRPLVAGQVDALLRDPDGARAFIAPFAGSWARMLGEDDPRPAELDLVPIVGRLAVDVPGLDGSLPAAEVLEGGEALGAGAVGVPVAGVPLPRVSLDWMADVRNGIVAATIPLAIVAAGFATAAFVVGERRRVLRRVGVWGVLAGSAAVVIPPLVVWAARTWATSADAVVDVLARESVSDVLPIAIVLVVGGLVAMALSFVPLSSSVAAHQASRPAPVGEPGRQGSRAASDASTGSPSVRPSVERRVDPTIEMRSGLGDGRAAPTIEAPTVVIGGLGVRGSSADGGSDRATDPAGVGDATDDDRDALWEYYS
jgi:hypothetical protein